MSKGKNIFHTIWRPVISNIPLGIIEFGVKDFKATTKTDKAQLGCYIEVGGNVLDMIPLNDPRNSVKIPLVKLHEVVRIIIKGLGSVDKKQGKSSHLRKR